MGEREPFIVKIILYPLSFIYGLVVLIRNRLFDIRILKSQEFHIPVISVGNITVGGTGKTPHVEYLTELLSSEDKVAILSRGYKRKTSEFIIANENTPVSFIGDEPWQLKEKYRDITVAVDTKRVRGIEKLTKEIPDLDVIILDDAFQHRYVKPGVNILLIDYNRQLHTDHLLPYGRLREHRGERYRADVVIFTKSPLNMAPIDRRLAINKLEPAANQHVFFTSIAYEEPKAVLPDTAPVTFQEIASAHYSILLVAGIANPKPLIDELSKYTKNIKPVLFHDHHYFTENDLKKIHEELNALPGDRKIVITTEKDVARLKDFPSVMAGPCNWYYIPIKIVFHPGEAELFSKYIFHYVRNNNRNSLLYKK
ncbi:MAG TPA: tetraacyldisaccharide 4'-kinase [Bacteroidales bacterium]|nr:tetraacyldisaccharide 4'-kinase [Bacteroidales bacterium]